MTFDASFEDDLVKMAPWTDKNNGLPLPEEMKMDRHLTQLPKRDGNL